MFVWTRNDMSCRDLSDLACSLRARFDCRTDSTNFTANDSRHKSSVNFLIADKCDIGSFHHGISRLDHGDQTPAFNHSKSFIHSLSFSHMLADVVSPDQPSMRCV